MAGFVLDGYEGRIPCPHCGSTDCCGRKEFKRGPELICVSTGKRVSTKALMESAKKHGMKKKANNMLFKAKTVEKIKSENPTLSIDKVYETHQAENWSELKSIDRIAKNRGTILHRFIREPVADGYAIYQIVKLNKKTVRIQHCTGYSDYKVSYWGDGAVIDRGYAENSVKGRDTLEELFKKKEAAP